MKELDPPFQASLGIHVAFSVAKHFSLLACWPAGIGSGGAYALSAARALIDIPDYDAERIGKPSLVRFSLTGEPCAALQPAKLALL